MSQKIKMINFSDSEAGKNYWDAFGRGIDADVSSVIGNDEGDRINAHYYPELADYLLSHMKWLTLWSNVCRDDFGYGRVPATSAQVESDFNNIKNRLFKNENLPMRVDDFIEVHVAHLNGKMKLMDAAIKEKNSVKDSEKDANPATAIPVPETFSKCPLCLEKGQADGSHK